MLAPIKPHPKIKTSAEEDLKHKAQVGGAARMPERLAC